MVRVLVVSPYPAVRAGLRALLGLVDDLAVVAEAEQLDAALEGAAPDVVVLDAELGLDPRDLAPTDPALPGPGLVVLGPVAGDEALPAALAGRAWGYLPRGASAEQLVAAVRAVGGGLLAIDPRLGGHLLRADPPAVCPTPGEAGAEELTAREREVLQLVAEGLANKMIAARLGISEHTVKFHVASILGKLGAASRTEAVHLGARRGLVAL